MSLLQIENLHKSYTTPDGKLARKVLDGLNLEVKPGESLAIVGRSGTGKTTLLNMIAALDQPDTGQVVFDGQVLSKFSSKQLDIYRNQSIGIVFQQHHLLPQLTLLENVLLPTLPKRVLVTPAPEPGLAGTPPKDQAEHLLKQVALWKLRHQKPSELSGGECQRTAVVRALINQPKLILADEPTGALDEENATNLVDLLIDMHKTYHTALIMVTHSTEMASRMDRTLTLKNGQLQ